MSSTSEQAMKTKATNLAKDPDYYRKIGRAGGLVKTKKGFASMTPEKRAEAGRRGGKVSVRKASNGNKKS